VVQVLPSASHPISTSSDRPAIQPHRSGQSLPAYQIAPQLDASAALAHQPSHARHQTSPDILPVPSAVSQRVKTAGTNSTFGSDDLDGRRLQHQLSLASPGQSPPPDSDDGESDTDRSVEEELKKLEEEFERSLQRAKKVFDSRMDNLQRSQIEREAQHQKTLEKHEKERAEFEKRLAQEEEQQMRRMEHLQREWEKKRQALAHSKRQHSSQTSGGASNGMRLSQESIDSQYTIGSSGSIAGGGLNPLSQGAGHHRRQASGNMSSQTLPPAALDQIYQPPMNGGQEAPR
jgi:Sds3-like